jgi:hypothetical protein
MDSADDWRKAKIRRKSVVRSNSQQARKEEAKAQKEQEKQLKRAQKELEKQAAREEKEQEKQARKARAEEERAHKRQRHENEVSRLGFLEPAGYCKSALKRPAHAQASAEQKPLDPEIKYGM